MLQCFAKALPPEIGVDEIDLEQVRAFVQQKRLSEWTRRKYYARLRTFFGFCVEQGFCECNPVDDLKAPPEGQGQLYV